MSSLTHLDSQDESTLRSTKAKPSGISVLFNSEPRPLNAYVVTSTQFSDVGSSYRSSAYFTASMPNSIAEEDNWSRWNPNIDTDIVPPSPSQLSAKSEPHYLSRTVSSTNYFDNASTYEVILDDGSRQKRTISLSTIPQLNSTSFVDTWIQSSDETSSLLKDKRNNSFDESSSSDMDDNEESMKSKRKTKQQHSKSYRQRWTKFQSQYLTLSHKQKMVLKCSFAYTIGSLFTFVPWFHSFCGTHVASHLAATVTVFFNPAKTVGGMIEAAGFGWLYTSAALALSLASMYTTNYFIDHDKLITAYAFSLGIWLAGSTFLISYLKSKINTPSVLTASGLAFIILFTVIVRQGSGDETELTKDIITETFSIVAIGTAISVAVCIFIWPMTASQKLKSTIDSSLSSTRVLLKLLTKTFLLDTDLPEFTANSTLENAFKTHKASFTTLKSALKEANLEFYNLEMKHHAQGYQHIVESLERLAQHVGGLKSSCGLQVEVMHQFLHPKQYGSIIDQQPNFERHAKEALNVKAGPQRKRMESELKRERISDERGALVQFIGSVRSPMKSLAYTCKQTIIHLQARFMQKTTQSTPSFQMMRQNLASAVDLFETSQHQALIWFYKRKLKTNDIDQIQSLFLAQHEFPVDDVYLVYFFVFCLLEFAKELMTLVESVQYVFEDMEELDRSQSVFAWTRYLWTRKLDYYSQSEKMMAQNMHSFVPNNSNTFNTLHTPSPKTNIRRFLLSLWGFFSQFRSHHVKFAFKSMLTAELISVLAFIPLTRPYFTNLKMEWTLVTVMAVMTPTVGGTNLGAILRILATIIACFLAAVIYTLFEHNTFMLWLWTWLVSIPSFWMILNHKHGRFGLFSLLAYNLIVLYKFNHRDDASFDVFELTWTRCLAVSLGVLIGLFVTAYVWPYEARTQVRKGLSDLLLRLSWLYKQLVSVYSEDNVYEATSTNALSILIEPNRARASVLQKIELGIQVELLNLQTLLVHAPNEPRLKGPFPVKTYSAMLTCCQNILDKLLAMRIVILKDVWAIHVRRNFLTPAANEFMEMAGNVFLYFYLLASALQLKTPLPPYLPPAEKARQQLMKKLQHIPSHLEEHMRTWPEEKQDEPYMIYYAYVVLMENIIRELELVK
ncbi:Fusaric acid resistance protein-like-domain-containing protein [Gilbertella persicaria]|uniref:Fusaric acid resistance protein-like-domain-containing protein n=1 Tax=Gilbertella persicaria TaxID=101096 RepID=UPI00221FF549|nr:Fusaric acid resistance protein-like-domain-containing protein [Gilbertella persicaria]KAI8047969.1 Fusaric acid resistance protein-like-domain-containing protein [Gilbertella persicaria]